MGGRSSTPTRECSRTPTRSAGKRPPTRSRPGDLAPYGEVEALAANNGFHYLGIAHWRARDAGALEPLCALEPLLAEGVAMIETPSSKCGETWARAKIEGGYAWYGSDIVANMEKLPPNFVVRQLLELTNSAPGYRLFNLAHKVMLKDRKGTLRAMLEDGRQHPPRVMVPAHGGILSAGSIAADTEQLLVAALG